MLQFAGAANLPICNKTFQKYIALHVKTVPVEFVYACIGNDYSFIKMKQVPTHNGIDVNTFLFICENGLNRTFSSTKDQFPVLESFVAKHLPPRPVNEQVYQTLTRKDKWKDRAIYLALSFKDEPEFYNVATKLFPQLKPKHFASVKVDQEMAIEFAKLIASIHVDEEMIAEKYPAAAPRLQQEEKETVLQGNKQQDPVIVFAPVTSIVDPVQRESILQQLEPFRKRSGLVPIFDNSKLVKQFLLSSIGALAPTTIMGKSQQGLTPLLPEEMALVSNVIDICTFDNNNLDQIETLKSLCKITRKKDWTPQLFLKNCISPETHLDELETRRFKNVNKDQDVIHVIMGLKI